MNIIILRENDVWFNKNLVEITGRRAEHICFHLKSSVGDCLRVGLLGGGQGIGTVEFIDGSVVRLKVDLTISPLSRHPFDIILGLPRPKMLRRIFRVCAEFGVKNIHLINSARVEKSYWQSPLLHPQKIEEALLSGLERSKDTIAPQVYLHKRFRPFVEDSLALLCSGRPCLVAEPEASVALSEYASAPAMVMIGPEGGFVPFELNLVQSIVARPVHLGQRILSVDTALVSVLAMGTAR